jgi:hypothetical protein
VEPLTAASTFATLLGLICSFKAGRNETKHEDYNEFVAWIASQRHFEPVKELESNHELSLGVKVLLTDNHQRVITKLKAIRFFHCNQ